MKINYSLLSNQLIVVGSWWCFLLGLLLSTVAINSHVPFETRAPYCKLTMVLANSREPSLTESFLGDTNVIKKKRLYSKMYNRVSLKKDEDAFTKSRNLGPTFAMQWWRSVFF